MAVLALTIIGQAVGSYFGATIGYAALGGAIGGAIGGYLGQSLTAQDINNVGPRLEDLSSLKVATEGTDIPQLYGDCRLSGQFIVADELTEHVHVQEQGGKGGPTVTTTNYTYTDTFAVAFGEPRLSAAKLKKCWHNKKLVEDYSASADATSSGALITFYDGTQVEPDPDLEALIGIGNVPAYKDISYGVYADLDLSAYGNRPPSIEVNLCVGGTTTNATTTISAGGTTLYGGIGYSEATATVIASFQSYGSLGSIVQIEPYTNKILKAISLGGPSEKSDIGLISKGGSVNTGEWLFTVALSGTSTNYDIVVYDITNNFEIVYSSSYSGADNFYYMSESKYEVIGLAETTLKSWDKSTHALSTISAPTGYTCGDSAIYVSEDKGFLVYLINNSTSYPAWSLYDGSWSTVADTAYGSDVNFPQGSLVLDSDGYIWALGNDTSNHPILFKIDSDGNEISYIDLVDYGATVSSLGGSGHPNLYYADINNSLYFHYTGKTWEFDLTSLSLTSYSDGVGNTWALPRLQEDTVWGGGSGNIYKYRLNAVTPVDINVADVIDDICNQANITDSFIDVSNITTTIGGYINPKQGPASAALSPLFNLSLSYVTNSDWILNFLPLGEAEVDTIDANDLGAREAGSDPVIPLDVNEPDSTLLPRKVQINYISSDGDLQPALAEAENYNALGNKIINLSLSATLPDSDAAILAQQTLQLSNESINYSFSLPRKYGALDAGDNIFLPTPQGNIRCRLTKADRGVNGIINFEGQSDSQENLVAVATAGANSSTTSTISSSSPAQIVYLDLPFLQDSSGKHPGPYLTAYTYGSAFPGVAFYQSTDDQTYTEVAGLVSEPSVFICETVPTTVDFENWDDTNTIRVTAITDDTLSSTTESNLLLNLANAAAWGRPGRWEIVQFETASLVSAGVYDLSHLLRGRRGTDNFMDNHVDGDLFIILSSSSLIRHVLSNSDIGTTRYYKAPLFGKYLADAIKTEATIGDVPLTPYSPNNLSTTDNTTTPANKDLSWDWRVRYDGVYGGPSNLTDGTNGTLTDNDAGSLRVLDDSDTVLNTYSITGTNRTYTEAEQISDYGAVPIKIRWQVAQTNTTAGLGYWSSIAEYILFAYLSYAEEVTADSPEAWWRLGESSGTTATDSSGNGHTGTYVNTPTLGATSLITGDSDTAVTFTASNSEYMYASGYKGITGTGTISLEALIQCVSDTSSVQTIINWGSASTSGDEVYFNIQPTTGYLVIDINGGDRQVTTASFIDNKKHHVSAVLGTTAADSIIYVDGEPLDDTTGGTGSTTRNIVSGEDVSIGCLLTSGSPSNYFNGTIDEPAIYASTLTDIQILRHAVSAFGGRWIGDTGRLYPTAWYRLGETSGTAIVDEMGGSSGTYYNSPTLNQTSLIANDNDASVLFNGSSQYGVLGTSFDPSSAAFSVELVWKTPSTLPSSSDGTLYCQQDGTGTGRSWLYCAHTDGTHPDGFYSDLGGTALYSGVDASAATTHHLLLTMDSSGNYSWYVDGNPENTGSVTVESANGAHAVAVNKTLAAEYLEGTLDEIILHSKELNATQAIDRYVRSMFTEYATIINSRVPTAYWRLGEATGTTAIDLISGNNATYVNSPTLGTTGLIHNTINTAVTFASASSQYAYAPYIASLAGTGALSLEAWVQTSDSSSTAMTIIHFGTAVNGENVYFAIDAVGSNYGRLRLGLGGGYRAYDADIRDGLTHHVVATIPTSGTIADIKLFLDGVQVDDTESNPTLVKNTVNYYDINLAAYDNAGTPERFFNGILDEVAIYDYELTAAQVKQNYRKGIL